MVIKYFDAHCHVQFDMYDPDRQVLIERMKEEGVGGLVVGVDFESSEKAVALAEKHEHLWASVGLHPNYEGKEWYEAEKYRELAKCPKVVAMGECGLDYFRLPAIALATEGPEIVDAPTLAVGVPTPLGLGNEVKKKQRNILHDQIALAAELDKPLIIHARPSKGTMDAYQDLIAILQKAKQKYPKLRGDVHFFVGGTEEMQALVALDFTVSFTAVITFARDYDEVIQQVPLTHILSETDSPYVAPHSRRGERNDPLAAIDVVEKIAYIRGENQEAVRAILLENAQKLFIPRT